MPLINCGTSFLAGLTLVHTGKPKVAIHPTYIRLHIAPGCWKTTFNAHHSSTFSPILSCAVRPSSPDCGLTLTLTLMPAGPPRRRPPANTRTRARANVRPLRYYMW